MEVRGFGLRGTADMEGELQEVGEMPPEDRTTGEHGCSGLGVGMLEGCLDAVDMDELDGEVVAESMVALGGTLVKLP
jgi:hypothetical protein